MTNAPRLVHEMHLQSSRLDARAFGYRLAGERKHARAAAQASAALREAIASLAVLAAMEGTDNNG